MAVSFAELKKSRNKIFTELTAKVESIALPSKDSRVDERFWTPTIDKAGNSFSVIRFLPAKGDGNYPWVSYWDHGFQGPTGLWYIEKSLTSIGKEDPVSIYNSQLWNSGIESDKEQCRKQKRRLHYVSNIEVITDSSKPECEGKQFLFAYGKKIFQKIHEAMNPAYADEVSINPFDFWGGANFKLKIRNFEGYRNYDKSEFDSPSQLHDDETLEKIFENLYSLEEFVDPTKYKTFDELNTKLKKVLQIDDDGKAKPTVEAPATNEVRKTVTQPTVTLPVDDDDIDTDFFKRLSEDN